MAVVPFTLSLEDWGKHLRADFRHDGYIGASYNIGGARAVQENGKEFGEQTFWDYAMKLAENDAGFQARISGKIRFEIPEETESFKPLPMLEATGNKNIGIVMDAGANITKELGAKNVITFGMCLDPASSPVQPNRNPIYFDPSGVRSVNIELSQFGFDREVIRSIRIDDVSNNGGDVYTTWIMGTGNEHHPMGAGNPKRINQIGGNYSGRKTAAGLEDMIGKTLGDTMIVASAMPSFGDLQNPYYLSQPGIWKEFGTQTAVTAENIPTSLAVKTGDILNAVRAIFKNVPVILERYIDDRVIKVFEYYPNTVAPEEIVNRIAPSYATILATVRRRYDDLIRKFSEATNSPDDPNAVMLQGSYSRFVVGSTRPTTTLAGAEKLRTAGKLFQRIRSRLEQLKTLVIDYFTRQQTLFTGRTITDADPFAAIMRDYNFDLEALKNLCPQTDTIIRDPRTKVMNPIIPITRRTNIGTVIPDMEIRLLTAFQAITNNGDLRNTVYFRQFEEPLNTIVPDIPGIPPGPDGGALVAGVEVTLEGELNAYAQDVIDEGGVRVGGQRGGAHTIVFNREGGTMAAVSATTAPILTKFIEYCSLVVGETPDRTGYVRSIYGLLRSKDSPRIASPVLLERIEEEFRHLANTGVLTLTFGEPVELPASSRDSLVYNAFAMHMNSLNLKEEDYVGFRYLERKFLNAAGLGVRGASVSDESVRDTDAARRGEKRELESESPPSEPTSPPRGMGGILSPGGSAPVTPKGKKPRASSAPPTFRRDEGPGSQKATQPLGFREDAGDWPDAPAGAPAPGSSGGLRTPRRKNRKSTYRLKKKPTK